MAEGMGFARVRTVAAWLAVLTAIGIVWSGERRSAALGDEVRWLQTRLGEKRELIARQRREMAQVADAIDHLTATTTSLGERAAAARHLAQLEESREPMVDLVSVSSTFDGRSAIVSEDAGRALEQLAWLDGQAASASGSIAVLVALLGERQDDEARGVPSLWPVRGAVTSSFGPRMSPYGDGPEMHAGLDIWARYGVPVTAAAGGEVVFAGHDRGYGSLVVIDHGGDLDTFYGHLSALYVREGQQVRRGQAIGAGGASGRATGSHLHYEVRVHGSPVDPRLFLARR